MPHSSTPGPPGTSCMTCKRRHKKCDQRRLVCERCEKGEFECLGYSHNERSVARPPPVPPQQRLLLPKPGVNRPTSNSASLQTSSDTPTRVQPLDTQQNVGPSSLSRENDPHVGVVGHPDSDRTRTEPGALANRTPNYRPSFTAHPLKHTRSSSQPTRSLLDSYTRIPYIPYHLSKTLLDSSNLEDYVLSQCDRMIETIYFRPAQAQTAQLRNSIVVRLRASRLSRWIRFICARICESFAKGDTSHNAIYNLWINEIDWALRTAGTLVGGGTDRVAIGDWLGVLFMRIMVVHGSNAYQVIRNTTPMFLQMVYSDPTLWPNDCDLTSVPLANLIASPRHEYAHFVLADATTALVFGLPQQVEYDTSFNYLPGYSVEHAYGSPTEFQILLVEINACRDKSPNAGAWEDIERKIATRQACPNVHESSWESWMTVAWLGVQESWRHTLLAYLYMSVCNVSSDDPRVQSSVRQILRLSKTAQKQDSSNATAPFFLQYLVAGICARSEKHRSIVRERLANVLDTRFWLLRAVGFVPVLDDLWHGAAANGHPIKWKDYVCSRERGAKATIPYRPNTTNNSPPIPSPSVLSP